MIVLTRFASWTLSTLLIGLVVLGTMLPAYWEHGSKDGNKPAKQSIENFKKTSLRSSDFFRDSEKTLAESSLLSEKTTGESEPASATENSAFLVESHARIVVPQEKYLHEAIEPVLREDAPPVSLT